jgi:hypothetical protein
MKPSDYVGKILPVFFSLCHEHGDLEMGLFALALDEQASEHIYCQNCFDMI